VEFRVDKNHMYIKSKKDPREEWVQTKYNIMEEDIQLVMQDWEPDWKVPTQGDEIA
jgi:NACalpha-BTF3-like transcription factor